MDTQAENHDTTPKTNTMPTITVHINILGNYNLFSFHKGDAHVGVKHSATHPTSDVRPGTEFLLVIKNKYDTKMLLIIKN